GEHVCGGDYSADGDALGTGKIGGAGNKHSAGARLSSGFRQGVAHFPRAVIGNIAYRVYGLSGGTRGDNHFLSRETAGLKQGLDTGNDVQGFKHSPQSQIATGLLPLG